MSDPVRVLLVDDSPLVLAKLKQIVGNSDRIKIVGTAKNGKEALELIPELLPAVICTDLYMPTMDGLELTREVMAHHPTPILVVSAGVQAEDTDSIFELLKAGAVDVLPKPIDGDPESLGHIQKELIEKILILSGVKVFRRKADCRNSSIKETAVRVAPSSPLPFSPEIILLGASTGGPQTLEMILQELPADFPIPIVCIQHIDAEFIESMVHWMDAAVPMSVAFARHGMNPEPGNVYFAPKERQLQFFADGRFDCQRAEEYNNFIPSVDLTFLSAARSFKERALACILTGMGTDGTEGLRAIFENGGYTIAQSGQSCVVDGMPKSARDAGVVRYISEPVGIGNVLCHIAERQIKL